MMSEVGSTKFKCGECGETIKIGIYDLLRVIATCPEKYLLEGEMVLCCVCISYMIGSSVLLATRIGRKERLSLQYDTIVVSFFWRYVYNPRRKYYIRLERISGIGV
jgi:hypothetical protein